MWHLSGTGPLHGLPMTIKNHPSPTLPIGSHSELLVTQLMDAGAVIFGYTNVPVGASDVQTYNATHGCELVAIRCCYMGLSLYPAVKSILAIHCGE